MTDMVTPKPHKWAKEIKAWADGAEIECRLIDSPVETGWVDVPGTPYWDHRDYKFRIKPKELIFHDMYVIVDEKKEDIVELQMHTGPDNKTLAETQLANLQLCYPNIPFAIYQVKLTRI